MYSGLGDLSYVDFVKLYLNQINPNTNMYWTMADVSAKTGAPLSTLQIMLDQAQQVNYQAVSSGAPAMSAPQIIAAGPPPSISQQPPPNTAPLPYPGSGIGVPPPPAGSSSNGVAQIPARTEANGFTYHNADGFGFRQGIDKFSYWEERDGTWSEGDLQGKVKLNIQWPPWFTAVDIQRAINKIIQIKGSEGSGGLPPATQPSGMDFGTLIGAGLIGYGLMTGNILMAAGGALTLLKK